MQCAWAADVFKYLLGGIPFDRRGLSQTLPPNCLLRELELIGPLFSGRFINVRGRSVLLIDQPQTGYIRCWRWRAVVAQRLMRNVILCLSGLVRGMKSPAEDF